MHTRDLSTLARKHTTFPTAQRHPIRQDRPVVLLACTALDATMSHDLRGHHQQNPVDRTETQRNSLSANLPLREVNHNRNPGGQHCKQELPPTRAWHTPGAAHEGAAAMARRKRAAEDSGSDESGDHRPDRRNPKRSRQPARIIDESPVAEQAPAGRRELRSRGGGGLAAEAQQPREQQRAGRHGRTRGQQHHGTDSSDQDSSDGGLSSSAGDEEEEEEEEEEELEGDGQEDGAEDPQPHAGRGSEKGRRRSSASGDSELRGGASSSPEQQAGRPGATPAEAATIARNRELARLAADNSVPPVTGGRARRKPDLFRYTEEDHPVRRKPKLSAAELQRQQRREAQEQKRADDAAQRRYTERQLILMTQQGKLPQGGGRGDRGRRGSGGHRGSGSDEEDDEDSEELSGESDDLRTGATGVEGGSTEEEEGEEEESDDPRRALLTEDEGAGLCRYPLRNKQAGQPQEQNKQRQQQQRQLHSRLRSRQQRRSSDRRKKGSSDRKRGRGSMWEEAEDALYDGDTLANAVKWRLMQGPSLGLPGGGLVTSLSGQPGLAGLATPGPGGPPAAPGMPPWADLGPALGGGGGSSWAGGAALGHGAGLAANTGKEKGGLGAEITPVAVDPSIDFDQVGGLDHYIQALKEMIFLPLIYPELFDRFGVTPPRGVLFYGPPGTGKTLVARALAAQASKAAGQQVTFFMRKGADLLSKWVGEAERQLRLLFSEAARCQPAIIFFDEIDGLAPVRSSKQDQVHNSIVSTLLALMDGLDSRGRVVVIGATNRPDALDGALRRPGRFDRELLFPLPDVTARASILRIHTRRWAAPPREELLGELAAAAVGYCGADLKALCTEASLAAVRRVYPQIYNSNEKLLVSPDQVLVTRDDFMTALQGITPAAQRGAAAAATPLSPDVAACLAPVLASTLPQLQELFPPASACMAASQANASCAAGGCNGSTSSSGSAAHATALQQPAAAAGSSSALLTGPGQPPAVKKGWQPGGSLWAVHRPRLLVCGPPGCGQEQLGPALLHELEALPIHDIGLPSLLAAAGARSLEEALVSALVEARRAAPAVLYLPQLHLWWAAAPPLLRTTLACLLRELPPSLPLLLLATAEAGAEELLGGLDGSSNSREGGAGGEQEQEEDEEGGVNLWGLFPPGEALVVELGLPGEEQRRSMFKALFNRALEPPAPSHSTGPAAAPAALPKAPNTAAQEAAAAAAAAAARAAYEADQGVLRALRMTLRGITLKLLCDRRWQQFAEPPDPEESEGEEYFQRVAHPMDLATLLARVDARLYATPAVYLADVALIVRAMHELHGVAPGALEAAQQQQQPQPLPDAAQATSASVLEAAPAAAAAAEPVAPDAMAADSPASTARAAGEGELPAAAAAAAGVASAAGPEDSDVIIVGEIDHQHQQQQQELEAGVQQDAATPAAVPLPPAAAAMPGRGANGTGPTAAGVASIGMAALKAISKAQALLDTVTQMVNDQVSPELTKRCEEVTERGPHPPPPGVKLPAHYLPLPLPPPGLQQGQGGAAAAGAGAGAGEADPLVQSGAGQRSSRRRGGGGDPLDRLLHNDPEALMRSLRGASSSGRHKGAAGSSRQPTPPASVAAGGDAAGADAGGEGAVGVGAGGAGSRQPMPAPEDAGTGAAGGADVAVDEQGPVAMQVDEPAPSALQQQQQPEAQLGASAGGAAASGAVQCAGDLPQPAGTAAAPSAGGQQGAAAAFEPSELQRELLVALVQRAVRATEGYTLQQLQGVYARCSRQLAGVEQQLDRDAALAALQRCVGDVEASRRG